jgi:RIO-like serine/threonine protein kinase
MGLHVVRASGAIAGVSAVHISPIVVTNDTKSARILKKLCVLHWVGFKHGDFRPQNVLVNEDGEVYLIDFEHSERHHCSGDCSELRMARKWFTKFTGVDYTYKPKRRSTYQTTQPLCTVTKGAREIPPCIVGQFSEDSTRLTTV